VIGQNAMAASTADTATPAYNAFMILPPRVFTKKVPMTEATMDAPPSTSG